MAGKKQDVNKRFWSKVLIKSKEECWEWIGGKYSNGYGQFLSYTGRKTGSHRMSYILTNGEIQDSLVVCHKCDNRSCVNPNHLFLGTTSDNLQDMIKKGRNNNPSQPGENNPNSKITEEIVVFHVPRKVCFDRIMARKNHPTINGKKAIENENKSEGFYYFDDEEKARQANSALDTFFCKYERVEDTEADKVTRLGWDGPKENEKNWGVMIVDLDGTLCNIDHRLHYVKNENKKHNRWDLFLKECTKDTVNDWCKKLIGHAHYSPVVFCSGRGDNVRKETEEWLFKNGFASEYGKKYRHLFMRHRQDYRPDYIIKEIILEFEIKPRYHIWMAVDDRKQVVDMWRKHGIPCLQCAQGNF